MSVPCLQFGRESERVGIKATEGFGRAAAVSSGG